MYKRYEGFFKGHKDLQLFFQVWSQQNAKGTVIITHGQGEHSEAYHRLTDFFQNDSWSFYAWDLRGHGRSEGLRGYVENFDEYVKDYEIFLQKILQSPDRPQGPVVLLCHSMGGLVQLKALIDNPHLPIDAIVCSSPALGLALPIPLWKTKGAEFVRKYMPKFCLGNEIENHMLTRDVDVIAEFEKDALRHGKISSAAFLGFSETWEVIHAQAGAIKYPALFLLPENDPIVSTPANKKFYDNIGSSQKEIYIYPDAKHEMFNDIHRQTVFQDLKKFLDGILQKNK